MPFNGTTYALPDGSLVENGQVTDESQHNTPLLDIGQSLTFLRSEVSDVGTQAQEAVSQVAQAVADLNLVGQSIAEARGLTPLDHGAIGDGVTDDTAAFSSVEDEDGPTVNLLGRTYSIVSRWVDPVNGAQLTKNYINGTLLVDGRELVMDLGLGLSTSAQSRARLPTASTSKRLGLLKRDDNRFDVWRHLLGPYWAAMQISRDSSGVPFNWRETFIRQVFSYKAARESGVTYTGSWATDGNTTALQSGSSSTFISGRAQQGILVGDYVEIDFEGGGDLYAIFSGRTSGNFVNVLLDGDQAFLTLPDDGGNRYFDAYTEDDLSHREIIQIASGVPQGSHTVRLTISSSQNANSSSGDRFIFNALSWISDDTAPWDDSSGAPLWQEGEVVLRNQERRHFGNHYYAVADGTAGPNPPTHTSGTVSDGGVDWVYREDSSYSLIDHRIQAIGSQLEYAYQNRPQGASSFEDVGGSLHGNEIQEDFQWHISGSKVTPFVSTWLVGDQIAITENLTVNHSEIDGGATVVNKTDLTRIFNPNGVMIKHDHEFQTSGEIGFFYAHMWPLMHYSSIGAKFGVQTMWTPSDGDRFPSDFYGQSNPFVGRTKDFLMVAEGECMQPDGSAGVPTNDPAPLRFSAWLDISPESVDSYRVPGNLYAFKEMNTSGVDVSNGGFSSLTTKMYFERNGGGNPRAYSSNEKISCSAFYGLQVFANT